MNIYADSSFIVSNYIQDTHSTEANRRMGQGLPIWITPLNRAELANVLHQYAFRGQLSAFEVQRAWDEFNQDSGQGVWTRIDLPETTWESSIILAQKHGPTLGVRTLDSLHVACALELKAQRFWTFDDRQARLAEAVGLDTSA
ncbi:MAG: type II toxin-antitoxin system VapC family toxin [Terracidiphilus sp.]